MVSGSRNHNTKYPDILEQGRGRNYTELNTKDKKLTGMGSTVLLGGTKQHSEEGGEYVLAESVKKEEYELSSA